MYLCYHMNRGNKWNWNETSSDKNSSIDNTVKVNND